MSSYAELRKQFRKKNPKAKMNSAFTASSPDDLNNQYKKHGRKNETKAQFKRRMGLVSSSAF